MQQDTPSYIWNSYGSVWLQLVMQLVSKRALQWYSNCCCLANVTKTFTLIGVQTSPSTNTDPEARVRMPALQDFLSSGVERGPVYRTEITVVGDPPR
jgi:hypothetical protein